MRRVFNSSVRAVAAVAVILALAGSAVALPREGRDDGRYNARDEVVRAVKRVVRALGDLLTVPRP